MASFSKVSFLMNKRVILVRYGGELGIKSRRTRRSMVGHLRNSLKNLLEPNFTIKIFDFRDRLLIYSENTTDLKELACLIVTSISGISSVSPVLVIKATEDIIISEGYSDAVAILQPNSSFAVRARREGKHPFSSMDIARKLGAKILTSTIEGIYVNLDSPDFQIFLDVRGPLAFIYTKVYKGMDGIPSQSQGPAIALIRPNNNSILAAWLMKKRGVEINPVFFKTGKPSEENFLNLIQSQFGEPLIIVSIEEFLNSFNMNSSLCLLCQLYCEQVCQKVTGEEKISVTISPTCFDYNNETMSLEALKILEKQRTSSILRPLQLGFFSQGMRIDRLDKLACCPYRSKVSIDISEDIDNTILEEVLTYKIETLSSN